MEYVVKNRRIIKWTHYNREPTRYCNLFICVLSRKSGYQALQYIDATFIVTPMKLLSLFILLYWIPIAFGADAYISAETFREHSRPRTLKLRSHVALVFDERDKEVIFSRHAEDVVPIASLTKLMTAMVILDAGLNMDDTITISKEDKDRLRYSRSRLKRGMIFTRRDLLNIALAVSENRAAAALARTYPGGSSAFVEAMNNKAQFLGLVKTEFVDSAGLGNGNVSTAQELSQLVLAASIYPEIREFTTQTKESITDLKRKREIVFGNSNRLVKRDAWPITLSKTGFTSDAGNCLVMKTVINDRSVIMVLLNSWGKLSKYGDSNRIRNWLKKTERSIIRKQARELVREQASIAKL